MLLSQRNAHPFDVRIQLTDKHVYILDNSSKDMVSCTTFNGRFFKPFIKTEAIANIITDTSPPRLSIETKHVLLVNIGELEEIARQNQLNTTKGLGTMANTSSD